MPAVTSGQWKAMGQVSGLGFELAIYLLIFVKGGEWLDGRFDTAPILQRVGVAVGIFAGFYSLWKLAKRGLNPPESSKSSESFKSSEASPKTDSNSSR